MVEVRVFDEPVVYEKVLFTPGFLSVFGFADKTLEVNDGGLFRYRHQALVVTVSKNMHDALLQAFSRQLEKLLPIAMEREVDMRIGQCRALELLDDVSHFHCIAFQEVAPSRNIVKEILNADARPGGQRLWFLAHQFRTGDLNACSQFILHAPRFQLYVGNRRDGGQRLPTEPHCADRKQVIRLSDFRRGMALETQPRIRYAHATAVVNHLDERLAAVFHNQPYL